MKLNPDRMVPLIGHVDVPSVERALARISSLHHSNKELAVTIFVSSGGGDVDAGFMFVDCVEAIGATVDVIGSGHIGSMAVPIFCSGRNRYVTKRSCFYLHELGYTPTEKRRLTITELKDRSNALEKKQRWYAEYVSKRTEGKTSPEKIVDMMRAKRELYAEDVLSLGIATSII